MVASVLLHLLCAPLQIFVVDHFYNGVADWLRYNHQGALLADMWRNGHFGLAGSGVTGILGNGSVSIAGGVVMTIVGPDQLAAFFVCAWLAYVGSVFFYLAFRVTFPRADRRWYALLIFLFPSLLFWTADASKEAFMLLGLGITVYGIALVMVGQRTGYLYLVGGGALSLFIRPNEIVILAVGFALAMVLRSVAGRTTGSLRRPRNTFHHGGCVRVRSGRCCHYDVRGRPLPAWDHKRRRGELAQHARRQQPRQRGRFREQYGGVLLQPSVVPA